MEFELNFFKNSRMSFDIYALREVKAQIDYSFGKLSRREREEEE
jgi:hypothetical protein